MTCPSAWASSPRASRWAPNYVIGLSPHYTPPDRDLVFKEVLLFVLDTAAPGDQVTIYDAGQLQPVTRFAIPQGALFEKNARARVQRLQGEVAALKSFLFTDRPHSPEFTGALQVPTFLALAGTQLRRAEERLQVILVGSPHYMSLAEPGSAAIFIHDSRIITAAGTW